MYLGIEVSRYLGEQEQNMSISGSVNAELPRHIGT